MLKFNFVMANPIKISIRFYGQKVIVNMGILLNLSPNNLHFTIKKLHFILNTLHFTIFTVYSFRVHVFLFLLIIELCHIWGMVRGRWGNGVSGLLGI